MAADTSRVIGQENQKEQETGDLTSSVGTGETFTRGFVPDIQQVPRDVLRPEPVITMSSKERMKMEMNEGKNALTDFFSNAAYKLGRAIQDPAKALRVITGSVYNQPLKEGERYIGEGKKRSIKSNLREEEKPYSYIDLSDKELDFALTYEDAEKADSIYQNFEAEMIIGNDFFERQNSRIPRTASEYKNLDYEKDIDLARKEGMMDTGSYYSGKDGAIKEDGKERLFPAYGKVHSKFQGVTPIPGEKDRYTIGTRLGRGSFDPKKDFFYGIENGKFKAGPILEFKDETVITPMRFGHRYYDENSPITVETLKIAEKDNSAFEPGQKSIYYSKKTGNVALGASPEAMIDFYHNNGDLMQVPLDDGSYSYISVAPEGETLKYKDLQDHASSSRTEAVPVKGLYTQGYKTGVDYSGGYIYVKPKKKQ